MTKTEKRWAEQLLAAFAPPGGAGLAPARGEVDYLGTFQKMLRQATPLAALGLRAAVWVAALAPLWLWGRLSTVSKLAVPLRTQLLSALLSHNSFAVRELATLLKFCAAMALLGTPSVRERSGYDSVQASQDTESGLRTRLPVLAQPPTEVEPAPATGAEAEPG